MTTPRATSCRAELARLPLLFSFPLKGASKKMQPSKLGPTEERGGP